LSIEIPEGNYQTVAGFVLSHLGKIPVVGDNFQHDDVGFTVAEMQGVKIGSIKIEKMPKQIQSI
jgi:putative hemolysin